MSDDKRLCPDEGTCHHDCESDACFRVRTCAPLSSYGEDWTPEDADRFGYKSPGLSDLGIGYAKRMSTPLHPTDEDQEWLRAMLDGAGDEAP